MKIKSFLLSLAVSVSALSTSATSHTITTPVPPRPVGATDLVGFAAEPIDTVRVGFIGLGMRGYSAVERFVHIPGTKIVAICDIDTAQIARSRKIFERDSIAPAAEYGGQEDSWKELCERPDIDLVYIVTDWKHHAPMALYAMEQGKHVAIEVTSSMNLD